MHPLNSHMLGSTGLAVTFYNGTAVASGYIKKQLSPNKFVVSDGTHTITAMLAPTTAIATALDSHPTYFTIPVYPANSSASGATFTPTYKPKAVSIEENGQGYVVGDVVDINGTNGAQITVNTVDSNGAVLTYTLSNTGGGVTAFPTNPQDFSPTTSASFDATISGTTLTVTTMTSGTIALNQLLFGSPPVEGYLFIESFLSGTGGTGTYTLNSSLTVSSPAAMTTSGQGGFFDIDSWTLSAVSASGGTGYTVGDPLVFNFVGSGVAAHISTVSSGAPTAVVVDSAGTITGAITSVGVAGAVEYVTKINTTRVTTTAGNQYYWARGHAIEQSAFIPTFGS